MDFGLLINAVESHPCLYDKKNKNYKNIIIKEAAWDEISEITEMPKNECKKRWVLLRDKFNKEQKKLDIPSGNAPLEHEDEWPYTDSMMFLKQFIQPRKTKSNHENEVIEVESQSDCTNDSETPKKLKMDHFTDTCQIFKEAIGEFRERCNKNEPAQSDPDAHFWETIKGLMADLPRNIKDQARVYILSYVTQLRSQNLVQ